LFQAAATKIPATRKETEKAFNAQRVVNIREDEEELKEEQQSHRQEVNSQRVCVPGNELQIS